jgi:hypothetical protein
MAREIKRYLVVRRASNKRETIYEAVSAPSKKLLRSYYRDWDSDTPNITYTTLYMKRISEKTYEAIWSGN